MEAALQIHKIETEIEELKNTFNTEEIFQSINEIISNNRELVSKSYEFATTIIPTLETNAIDIIKQFKHIPSECIDDIINKTFMPISFKPGSYGISPNIFSKFNRYGVSGTHREILDKSKILIEQIDQIYKTLYNHAFDYVKLTFYCGKCKKVNETFFDKMPHPSIHITCPKCLTEKMIPIHNNLNYKNYNYRYHKYTENEYHPLQMEGVVLGLSNKENGLIVKSINS